MIQAPRVDEEIVPAPLAAEEPTSSVVPPQGHGPDVDADLAELVKKLADDLDDPPVPSPQTSTGEADVTALHPLTQTPSEDRRSVPPSHLPKPKINLAAIQKAANDKGVDQAKQAVSRLFGPSADEDVPEESVVSEAALGSSVSAESDPVDQGQPEPAKPMPAVLIALDQATARLERLHPLSAPLLGWIGVFLAFQSILVMLLAFLGWI